MCWSRETSANCLPGSYSVYSRFIAFSITNIQSSVIVAVVVHARPPAIQKALVDNSVKLSQLSASSSNSIKTHDKPKDEEEHFQKR